MLTDPLANLLGNMKNATIKGKQDCSSKPSSKIISKVLEIMKDNHYVGDYKIIEDKKGGVIEVQLTKTINNCGVIKPRFSVNKENYEKYEKRYLPAKGFGIIIVSTSQGIMTLDQSKEKGIGGKLIAYIY
tara:strand:+ start:83 stop:472 length:390 start_codon:yes stop_codon:yes gene_type:complete